MGRDQPPPTVPWKDLPSDAPIARLGTLEHVGAPPEDGVVATPRDGREAMAPGRAAAETAPRPRPEP